MKKFVCPDTPLRKFFRKPKRFCEFSKIEISLDCKVKIGTKFIIKIIHSTLCLGLLHCYEAVGRTLALLRV